MGVKNRVVALTVGMVMLAGILSGVAAFLTTRHTIDEYNDAMMVDLQRKASAYTQAGRSLLPENSEEALAFLDSVIDDALAQSLPMTQDEPSATPEEFENPLLGFSVRASDASAPSGFRIVMSATLEGYEELVADSEAQVLEVVTSAAATDGEAAAVDAEHQTLHGATLISAEGEPTLIATFTLGAADEFAFFAQQRADAIHESIIASVGIVLGVAAVGAVLSMLVSRDLTSRRQVEEALREQTRRDPLTGVLNHPAIIGELEELLALGDEARAAVVMVDVDGMKATNDTFGHQVGDQALKAVATALDRDGAKIGRYGGDEFVAILDDHDRQAAERYQRDAGAYLAGTSLTDAESGIAVPVSVSMGLAVCPEDAATVNELVGLADHAMYASRLKRPLPPAGQAVPRRRDERALMMIGEIAPLLTSDESLEDKLKLVAHRLAIGAKYDAVTIELVEPGTGKLVTNSYAPTVSDDILTTWHDQEHEDGGTSLRPWLERTRRPTIVNEIADDARMTAEDRALAKAAGMRSLLTTPMLWRDEVMGTLSVASVKRAAFTPSDAQFVSAVATQVTAITRLSLLLDQLEQAAEQLSEAHEETIMLLAAAAETREHTIGPHCHRVRRLAEALAEELGWSVERSQELGLAAALHDIGKIHLPDTVLANTGVLAPEEWEAVKQHTVRGEQLLQGRPGFELAAAVARSHHERWDGTGYPSGLAGKAIPEAAAIVAVADAFDAMTAARMYKEAVSIDEAVAEIAACAGRQFSPDVAQALRRLHERGAVDEPPLSEEAAA